MIFPLGSMAGAAWTLFQAAQAVFLATRYARFSGTRTRHNRSSLNRPFGRRLNIPSNLYGSINLSAEAS
jgi:hypothetical protein